MTQRRLCFVIMPFSASFYYFYLYLRDYIEREHNMDCERADTQVLTVPILDKITEYITDADVVIADCTGRNPNVFYELGIAHALGKPVILLTQDEMADVPSDVKQFEFIRYRLDEHEALTADLDNALFNVFSSSYQRQYDAAQRTYNAFSRAANISLPLVSMQEFTRRVQIRERDHLLPDMDTEPQRAEEVLIYLIIEDALDPALLNAIREWLETR